MRRAFIDADGILRSHGFMAADGEYRPIEVDVDFELQPGEWKFDNGEWVPVESASTESGCRLLRTLYLQATDWCVQRHMEQQAMSLPTTLGVEQYHQLLEYRQRLRDLPTAPGFPEDTRVPPIPGFLGVA